MSFLAMLIALSLHQLLQVVPQRPGDAQLLAWQRWLAQRVSAPGPGVLLTLLVPAALALWWLDALEGWLFGLLSLALSAALLLWSLGREDYHTAVERYLAQREAGDEEGAWLGVQRLWLPQETATVVGPDDAAAQGEERLLYCGYQRWFAPLLYFLLLGPVAAALYRMVQLFARREDEKHYRQVLRWLDWLPARVLALSFAVTGDFTAVLQGRPLRAEVRESHLLLGVARAAAGPVHDPRALSDLMYRTAGLWLLLASLWFIIM